MNKSNITIYNNNVHDILNHNLSNRTIIFIILKYLKLFSFSAHSRNTSISQHFVFHHLFII